MAVLKFVFSDASTSSLWTSIFRPFFRRHFAFDVFIVYRYNVSCASDSSETDMYYILELDTMYNLEDFFITPTIRNILMGKRQSSDRRRYITSAMTIHIKNCSNTYEGS